MSTPLDPRWFMVDGEIKPFMMDMRVDLTDPAIATVGTGKYVVFDHTIAKGQTLVVKAIVPWAQRRIDVDLATESFEMIPAREGDGWFAFEPLVGEGGTATVIQTDFNSPKNIAGVLNNNDRVKRNGFSHLSDHPLADANQAWANPMPGFLVESTRLRVTFEVMPISTLDGNAISNAFQVGGKATKRVDFAAVIVVGMLMSSQFYKALEKKLREAGHG